MGHDGIGEGSASIAGMRVGNSSNWTQATCREAESSPVMTSDACRWSLKTPLERYQEGKGIISSPGNLYLRESTGRFHRGGSHSYLFTVLSQAEGKTGEF